jgi:hypothetical protein
MADRGEPGPPKNQINFAVVVNEDAANLLKDRIRMAAALTQTGDGNATLDLRMTAM